MIEHCTNMRQHNETTYSEVLNRIRSGEHTTEDIQLQRTLVSLILSNCKILCLALPCTYCQERSKSRSI